MMTGLIFVYVLRQVISKSLPEMLLVAEALTTNTLITQNSFLARGKLTLVGPHRA